METTLSQPPPTREAPKSLDAERAVVGAMLIDDRAVDRAVEVLGPDGAGLFYHRPNGRIYDAILAVHGRDERADQLTVSEELKRRGQLDEVGGVVYLAGLAGDVASAANVTHHAGLVLEPGLSRWMIEAASDAQSKAYTGQLPVKDIADGLSQRLFEITERRKTGGWVRAEDGTPAVFERIDFVHQHKGELTGVDTGLVDMNGKLGGFQRKDLIIEAARPSMGKTGLSVSHAVHAAVKCGVGVGFFSLEMGREQILQRSLSMLSNVELHAMRHGRLSDGDWPHLVKAVGPLNSAPLYVDDTPAQSIMEVRGKARQLMRKDPSVGLFIVDYLQLMVSGDKSNTRDEEIGKISRGLKAMAKELDVPVIALSQLSRAPEARADKRPQLSDLRESGSIEQDADVVMFIYRPDYYGMTGPDGQPTTGLAEIIIAKQRNGPTGTVYAQYHDATTQFRNLAPSHWAHEMEAA